jgi:hypothetical protein
VAGELNGRRRSALTFEERWALRVELDRVARRRFLVETAAPPRKSREKGAGVKIVRSSDGGSLSHS